MDKFIEEKITAKGEERAWVSLKKLKTLWFNTGTQCNLKCENCYIESSPKNDRLVYLTKTDVRPFLDEIQNGDLGTELIAFTGGEPFINPNIISILDASLKIGLDVLVLTNAYRILDKHKSNILELKKLYGKKLHLRVSLDHHTKSVHEAQRGEKTFDKTMESILWLYENGFNLSIAGRSLMNEIDPIIGYQGLLTDNGINITLKEFDNIVIFPEMNENEDVPEITTKCWDILKVSPDSQMCASERMIVKRKGMERPTVLPCTLIAYDEKFDLGTSLKEAKKDVYLNHPYCSKFCVLGGASCSSAK